MKNKVITLIFLVLALIMLPAGAIAAEEEQSFGEVLESSLDGIDFSEWQKFLNSNEIFGDITSSSPNIRSYIEGIINGNNPLDFNELINIAVSQFLHNIKTHAALASILFGIGLLCALCKKFSDSVFTGKITNIAVTLCFFAAVGIIVKSFADVSAIGIECVKKMSGFVDSSVPVLMVLVTAIGGTASSQLLQPAVIIVADLMTKLITYVIIPLLTASGIMSICSRMSEKKEFQTISTRLKKLAEWIIGIMFTLFIGFISIQKLTSSALDGLSVKTVKYALSSFSLYGGSFLSKSVDIVTSCAVVTKNLLGGAGMVILISLCLAPALELCAMSLVYRIAGVLISALPEEKISGCMDDIAGIYGTMFLCVVTCAVVFFILLTVITSAGNTIIGV